MPDHSGSFLAGGALAGAQNGGDGLVRLCLQDQDRLEARVPRMGREQRELLAAMGEIDGIVDVEHDPVGHAGVAVAESVDHPQPHACEHPPAHRVLQPRKRRLRGQPDICVRALVAGDLQSRIWRSTSRSSQSSCPQAMAIMRDWIIVA